MKSICRIITVLAVVGGTFMGASAATQKEMDQARAIAAKYYMRYANYQSDYLDKIEPQSMLELEGSIKEADRSHFNEVKNVKVPDDYANWSKTQFVTYWKTQFFQANINQFSNKDAALSQEAMRKRTADVQKIGMKDASTKAPQKPQPNPKKKVELSDLISKSEGIKEPTKNSQNDIIAQKEELERQKAVAEVNRKQAHLNYVYQMGLDKQKEVEAADLARKEYKSEGKTDDIIEVEMEQLDRRYYDLKSEYESIKLEYYELVEEYIPSE